MMRRIPDYFIIEYYVMNMKVLNLSLFQRFTEPGSIYVMYNKEILQLFREKLSTVREMIILQ